MQPFSLPFRVQRGLALTACALLTWLSATEASAGLVQSTGKRVNSNWATTITENATSNFTVGNTVIVSMAFYGSGGDLTSVVIAGTTATLAVRSPASFGGDVASVIYYAKVVNAGQSGVVLNGHFQQNITTLSIDEWSELQDNPLDQTGSAGPISSNSPSATSGTLAQAGEVVYFALGYLNTTQASITAPAGYTTVFDELAGTVNAGGAAYYKIVSSTAAETPTATLATADSWTAAIATFRQVLGPIVNITGTPPATVVEGNGGGTNPVVFTLTRTGATTAFNVTYSITGGVISGEDYSPVTSTVAFAAGQATRTITVSVLRDTKFEIAENLTLTLTGADGGGNLGATTVATTQVLNDDNPPTISIGNRTGTEGGLANFPVTLSNGSYLPVSVTATTLDGTANGVVTAPFPQADYTSNAPGGTVVTFAANTTVLSQNFGVQTVNDTVYEGPTAETYFVNLSIPNGGVIGVGTGNGSITDNDPIPTVSITATTVVSQSELVSPFAFTVTLSRPSVQTILVTATAMNGTAQQTAAPFAVADFAPLMQFLTFIPGDTSESVNVTINDDLIDEANETFSVQLTGLSNANPVGSTLTRTGTITDNDALPALSVVATSTTVSEGPLGSATFTVSINGQSGQTVSVTAQTVASPGTALAGADYTATGPSVLTWLPGDVTPKMVTVPILEDGLDEAAETFRTTFTPVVNATVSPGFVVVTITDNDPIPTVSISDVSVTEGNAGTTAAIFTVSLSAPSGQTITVRASTANGTATTANSDYVGQTSSVLLTFNPLQTTQQFTVTVNGDNVLEQDETFFVNLTLPSATVTILDGQGVGTINNDDSPALSINDATIQEGNLLDPPTMLTFTVHIPDPAPVGGVGFDFDTSDGTATLADSDYTQVSGGSGFIAEGFTSTTVSVPVTLDNTVENLETMTVMISNPVVSFGFVTILDATATGTIQNDDAIPAGDLVISEFRLSGPGGPLGANAAEDEFIEIANTTSSDITVFPTDGSAGFSVARAGGVFVVLIPNGTTIPARGHFLAANSVGYSLSGYGGPNTANTLFTWTTDIPPNTGLALFPTSIPANYPASTPLDAVGFTTDVGTQYVEGPTGLTGIGTGPFAHNYSFVRKHAVGAGEYLVDGTDSAADFVLVAVDAGTYGTVAAILGGPSPENLTAETERSPLSVAISGTGSAFTGSVGVAPKALEFRRTFTNLTAAPLTDLRFKVTSLTTLNSPTPGVADLRPTNSLPFSTFLGLTLEGMPGVPTAGYVLTTPSSVGPGPAFDPFPAGTLPNGGLNSTWRVLAPPVAAFGGTVDVNFRVEYTISGAPFLLWVVPAAK